MVVTRRFKTGSESGSEAGSHGGPALTEDRVREIISEEVIEIVRGQSPKMFRSNKTAMMEYFDDRYATIVETAATIASAAVVAASTRA